MTLSLEAGEKKKKQKLQAEGHKAALEKEWTIFVFFFNTEGRLGAYLSALMLDN